MQNVHQLEGVLTNKNLIKLPHQSLNHPNQPTYVATMQTIMQRFLNIHKCLWPKKYISNQGSSIVLKINVLIYFFILFFKIFISIFFLIYLCFYNMHKNMH